MRDLIDLVETAAEGEVKVYHVTPEQNVPRIMRSGLLPKRGARSRSAGEKQPAIYVFPDWLSLEDGVSNWLGDEFDEDMTLSVLELTVPRGWLTQHEVRWEAQIHQPVPPDRIRVLIPDIDAWNGKAPEGVTWSGDP